MDDKLITCDLILNWLRDQVEQKREIAPSLYIDACTKLNLLLGNETDHLYDLQQKVSLIKVGLIEADKSVAEAKTRVEATEEYKQMKKQEAKIGQIEEAIRIAKIRARLKDNE